VPKPRKKRKAKTPIQKLKILLDGQVRTMVRRRDNDTCQWCGAQCYKEESHPHHIIPKSTSLFLRWDLINIILLCKQCHCRYHDYSTDGEWWFSKKHPDRWAYLHGVITYNGQTKQINHILTNWTHTSDYQKILDNLTRLDCEEQMGLKTFSEITLEMQEYLKS
jgi:hypothetical protein